MYGKGNLDIIKHTEIVILIKDPSKLRLTIKAKKTVGLLHKV